MSEREPTYTLTETQLREALMQAWDLGDGYVGPGSPHSPNFPGDGGPDVAFVLASLTAAQQPQPDGDTAALLRDERIGGFYKGWDRHRFYATNDEDVRERLANEYADACAALDQRVTPRLQAISTAESIKLGQQQAAQQPQPEPVEEAARRAAREAYKDGVRFWPEDRFTELDKALDAFLLAGRHDEVERFIVAWGAEEDSLLAAPHGTEGE